MPLFLAIKVCFSVALEEIIKRNALLLFYSVYVVGQRKVFHVHLIKKCYDDHPAGFDSLCMAFTIRSKYDHLENQRL